MRDLFKNLVPILLVISMIFSLGVETISIDNLIVENSTEQEETLTDPPKEEVKEEQPQEPEGNLEAPKEEPTEEQLQEPEENLEAPKEEVIQNLTAIMPMGISTPGNYTSDPNTIVVPTQLTGVSINDHTIPSYVWSNNGFVYAAVKSTHYLQYMTLSGLTSTTFDEYNPLVNITIDGVVYEPIGLKGNIDKSHWTVFKFTLSELYLPTDGILTFFIKGIGGGHDVGGEMTVIVPKIDIVGNKEWIGGENWPSVNLQLKRYITGSDPSTAMVAATGTVDGMIDVNEIMAWSYKWKEVPEYSPYGQKYIYYVDEETVPQYYEKTIDVNGGRTVINTYNPPQGKITITKTVVNPKDPNQEFDIFINGPNGTQYVVTLKSGESKTIENLDLGSYTISEIVPMNYKLVGISNPSITLTVNNLEHSTIVTNKHDNDGWFYDDDIRKNTFKVGIISESLKEVIIPKDSEEVEDILENND